MKRILVIADDLTGAAEIAGIGLRHRLSTRISRLQAPDDVAADLIVIDTDSRLLSSRAAATRLRELLRRIDLATFDLLYKKTDSALRGNIVAEATVLLEASKRRRVVLVAQNPSRGRTIRDGIYYINDIPLHQTDFGKDADRPIPTSNVAELLTPPPHVAVQNASIADEVASIAKQITPDDLPAGGADFFEANLRALGCTPDPYEIELSIYRPKLFICGSAAESRLAFVEKMKSANASVFAMPDDVFRGDADSFVSWREEIRLAISEKTSTMVFVPQPIDRDIEKQAQIRTTLAKLVVYLCDRCSIASRFLEGGATAAAVCEAMNWDQLKVIGELARGIVVLSAGGVSVSQIIIKPGSYPWCSRVVT